MDNLLSLLKNNPYPGRGIVAGMSPDGLVRIAYFIMGRSMNSRNRIFVMTDENTMETRAYDPSRMVDPSLIIYAPFRRLDENTYIVTNGDQTDTIRDYLLAGKTFRDALMTRTFEPDGPNYTPRISALVSLEGKKPSFELSVLKSFNGNPDVAVRNFYSYDNLPDGAGLFVHTYVTDGDPIPSFEGEPERVVMEEGSLTEWTQKIWDNLHHDNKVSLLGLEIRPADKTWSSHIINRYA